MRLRLAALACLLSLAAAPAALAQSTTVYDGGWYKSEFWSGEYPNGFTVLVDTNVMLRPALDPAAEKSIACPLPAGASYHPWNHARVESDGLAFAAFTQIDEMEVTTAYATELYSETVPDGRSISFEPGMRWRYLVYYGEGSFLMEYDGERFTGDFGLMEVSKSLATQPLGYDEWMRINCANNQWGWLFMVDITRDGTTIDGPNITEYGEASDRVPDPRG